MSGKDVIDVHVHFGAPSGPDGGCWWSERFADGFAYLAMKAVTGTLFKAVDYSRIKKHLFKKLHRSKLVDKAVFLALDMVYDTSGNPHLEDLSHLYTSNQVIAALSVEYRETYGEDRILPGASVHPFNPRWEEELDWCLENGAVLIKWLPSAQMIDLSHPKCLPFYDSLAAHNLPLLCHAGPEYSIPTSDESFQEFNNPGHLRPALERGVPVILAHCALPLVKEIDGMRAYDEMVGLFSEADSRGWKLYADLSALLMITRSFLVREAVVEALPHERLIMGSDYPIPISEAAYIKGRDFFKKLRIFWTALKLRNPLDKNRYVLGNMGFDPVVFTSASDLFSLINL
jgi:predicted TIM-barrel fold metal-dependent hydrolase